MSIGSLNVMLELDGADNFIATVNRAGSVVQNLTKNVQQSVTVINQSAAATNSAAASAANLIVALGQAQNAFNFLKTATTGFAQKIIDINSKMESMVLLLKGISTASTEIDRTSEALANFNFLLDKASSSPFKLDKLTDAFVKLKGAGIEPTEKALTSIVDAVAHFGGNDQTLDRVALALQQMAGKGVVSMEELRRQLGDAVPGAMKAMAQAMNLTMGQLTAAVTKGTLESKNAIRQMTDEFERLYGGSAVQKLATYGGQIALLQTQIQRLALVAGGQDANGSYVDGGFFKVTTNALKEFNSYLKTPEVTAFAITVDRALAGITEALVTGVKWLHDYADTLIDVAKAVAVVVIGYKAMALAQAALTSPALIGFLTNLISSLGSVGSIALSLGSGAFVVLRQSLANIGTALTAASSAWMFWLQGMSGIAGQAAAASASLLGLPAVVIAVGAIAVALGALALKLSDVENHGKLASEALDRVRQGDTTRTNEAAAAKELDSLKERLTLLQKLADQGAKFDKSGRSGAFEVPGIAGSFGSKGVESTQVAPESFLGGGEGAMAFLYQPSNVAAKMAADAAAQTKSTLAQLDTEIAVLKVSQDHLTDLMANLPNIRINDAAKTGFQIIKQTFDANLFEIENIYRQKMDDIDKRREDVGGKQDSGSLNTIKGLNSEAAGVRDDLYAGKLAKIEEVIAKQRALETKASQDGQRELAQQLQIEINMLEEFKKQLAKQRQDETENVNRVITTDASKQVMQRAKEAQNLVQQMQARIESLNAEAAGASGSLAKLVQYMNETGKFGGVNDDLKDQVLKYGTALADAEQKLKRLHAEMQAEAKIDSIVQKAGDDISNYITKINDPTMPEAQRSFIALQDQVNAQLRNLQTAAKNGTASLGEYLAGLHAVAEGQKALDLGRYSTLLQQLNQAKSEGDAADLQKMTPQQRRVAAGAQIREKYSGLRNQVMQTPDRIVNEGRDVNGGTLSREQQLALLDKAEASRLGALDRGVERSGAGAAKAADNAVTQMAGRIAQMKAQIEGSRGELAKWNAELDRGKYASQADAIRKMAAEEDRLAEILKKVQVAKQAESTLKTNVEDTASAAEEMRALNAEVEGRGKLLGIERELFDYKRRQQKEVIRVGGVVDKTASPEEQIAQTNRVAAAQKAANEATRNDATQLALRAMDDNKTETATILKSFETSLSKRREMGYQEVKDFEASQRNVIKAAQLTADERKKIEDQLAEVITAKRQQVDRQTENGFEKWVRESADMNAQIGNFGASAFGQLTDALTSMAETGKFKFSDLANWAIKEMTRILVSSAFAQLFKAGGVGGSGGSSGSGTLGTILGAVGSIAGAAFGGGGGASIGNGLAGIVSGAASGATGYDNYGNVGKGFYGPPQPNSVQFHTGGMNGEGVARSINAAIFANAPRFHTGTYLKSGEVPAILRDDEAVFTQGQLGAIGRMNHSYGMVEDQIAGLASAVGSASSAPRIPNTMAPAASYDPSNRAQGAAPQNGIAPPMTVNLNNQTGTNMGATAAQPRFDGEQWVVDIVMKHANQPGALRTSLQGMNGGR